jgi:hypothetical protein
LSIPLEVAHVVVVSLDGAPLATSRRMLLQVMTEEKATGFRTESLGERQQRIVSIGENPWLVRQPTGRVRLKRSDAARLRVTALDPFGLPTEHTTSADNITLQPTTVYYAIEGR